MYSRWILSVLFVSIYHLANAKLLGLKEDSICNGGICKLISECDTIGDFRRIRPAICSFQDKTPIICCPTKTQIIPQVTTTTEKTTTPIRQSANVIEEPAVIVDIPTSSQEISDVGNKAKRKCLEYSSRVCPSQITQFRAKRDQTWQFHQVIVGGRTSKPRELPFMALIGYGKLLQDVEWACGGSLISTYWVLSAAHCEMSILKAATWIKLGELDLESDTDDARPTNYIIEYTKIHPEYKVNLHYNDIALHKSSREITFNSYIAPICLQPYLPSVSNHPWVAGWGQIEFAGARSPSLKQAQLKFVRTSNCSAYFGKKKMLPMGINASSQICAGSVLGEDTCQGDSGGPLFQIYGGTHCLKYQVGITSFGIKCAKGPAVYTWILNYMKWIEETVWPEDEKEFTFFI